MSNLDPHLPTYQFKLEPNDSRKLATLCGPFDAHLRQIEKRLGITISNRGNHFHLEGEETVIHAAGELLQHLYQEVESGINLTPQMVNLCLQEAGVEDLLDPSTARDENLIVTRYKSVKPKGRNQNEYVARIRAHDINFGIGPAGTGKTYLAVACAVEALENDLIRRILLVRPAVEAGEKLGFLPGDLSQKINPYLRPLYDSLYDLMGFERFDRLVERGVIEIAPLAYMRGRTLNDSFIILDESQNTTQEQMKMFLTRTGFGSTVVVTGDITQIDLPKGTRSGLVQVMDVLKDIGGISFTHFEPKDVVRHPLVQRIVEAYQRHEGKRADH